MPGGATSGEPAARVGVRGVRVYDGVEVVTGHSDDWREWWAALCEWWPSTRRVTKAEERDWFLVDDGSAVEVENLTLGL
jgi:hypothetical protein